MKKKAEVVSLNLRLGPNLHKAMKRISKKHNRSLNAQIVHVLERFVQFPVEGS